MHEVQKFDKPTDDLDLDFEQAVLELGIEPNDVVDLNDLSFVDTAGGEKLDPPKEVRFSFETVVNALKRVRPRTGKEKALLAESLDRKTAQKVLQKEWMKLPESIRLPEAERNDIPVAWPFNPMPSSVDLYSLSDENARKLSDYLQFRDEIVPKITKS